MVKLLKIITHGIEFSVGRRFGMYYALVNDRVFLEDSDYEKIRSAVLEAANG